MFRIFLFTVLLAANISCAASFDCGKAGTSVEKTICSDKELSRLDDLLTAAYRKALADMENVSDLRASQISWLKDVRNHCQDADCLKAAYLDRLDKMQTFLEWLAENNNPSTAPKQTKLSRYANSLNIPERFLLAPLAFFIGGEVDISFVKFIDATFRFGHSKPLIKAEGDRVIIRLNGQDELTGEETRTDYLVVAHDVNGKTLALVERMLIADSDGVRELEQNEIPVMFGLLWAPLISTMD